jgi:hypothetical protein
VANSIHTRDKLVQIVLIFLILGIAIIWCHYFTKLTSAGKNAHQVHFLNFLLCFVHFHLLFYSSYILRRRLWTTRHITSSTTSSKAPEEARPAAILGTTKRRCLHVFTLDFYERDLVYGCYVVYIWM